MIFVRTPFNYDMHAASLESALLCSDGTRTQQQFQEECDINTIVRRFGLTGQLPEGLVVPMQGDFTNVVDFQSAMNMVIAAQDSFMEMPAHVRDRFSNDPQRFLDFVSDPANLDEARKLGIANPATSAAAPAVPPSAGSGGTA